MKITFPHSELLQASHGTRQSLLMLIAGSLITGLGIFATFKHTKVTQLDCDRTSQNTINCQWQEQGIFQTRQKSIIGLTAVEVEVNEGNLLPLYRLHLIMEQGEMPFIANYTDNVATIQHLGGQINTFITDPSSTPLTVRLDHRLFGYGMGSMFSAIGLFCLCNALWRPCIFMLRVDRRRALISVEYRSLIRHCQTNHYPIQGVRSVTNYRFEGDGREQIGVLMDSGEFLSLILPEQVDDIAKQRVQSFFQ